MLSFLYFTRLAIVTLGTHYTWIWTCSPLCYMALGNWALDRGVCP